MPLAIRCPSCRRHLRVPDDVLRQAVQCPGCSAVFTAEEGGRTTPVSRAPAEAAPPEPPARHRQAEEPAEAYQEGRLSRPGKAAGPWGDEGRLDRVRHPRPGAVTGPAVALCVFAALLGVYGLIAFGSAVQHLANKAAATGDVPWTWDETFGLLFGSLHLLWAALVLAGAVQMLRFRGHRLALAACFLATLPVPVCCFLGIPVGLWGLIVLTRPEVRRAYRQDRPGGEREKVHDRL
jgi:hypothetical protein